MTESIENSDSKRQAIMQAAKNLFLTHNYRCVSMDKIAQAAPVSKATLYNYFDSKNELLVAVVSKLSTELLQTITQTLSDADDVEQTLKKIAFSVVEFLYSSEGLAIYRLVISESHEFPELGQMVSNNGVTPLINQLDSYLQRLNDSDNLSIFDTRSTADVFFSLLKGELHFRCLLGVQPPPNELEKAQLIESATTFYLRGIGYAKN